MHIWRPVSHHKSTKYLEPSFRKYSHVQARGDHRLQKGLAPKPFWPPTFPFSALPPHIPTGSAKNKFSISLALQLHPALAGNWTCNQDSLWSLISASRLFGEVAEHVEWPHAEMRVLWDLPYIPGFGTSASDLGSWIFCLSLVNWYGVSDNSWYPATTQ